MSQSTQETEIKLAVPSPGAIRRTLRAAGFRVSRKRVFESNAIYDTAAPSLRPAGTLLRLRQAGRTATLTYKGPVLAAKHKSREEVEGGVAGQRPVAAIL